MKLLTCDVCKRSIEMGEECLSAVNQNTGAIVAICLECTAKMQEVEVKPDIDVGFEEVE